MKSSIKKARPAALFVTALAVVAGAGLWLAGCGRAEGPAASADGTKTLYTCGMHPQVIQDKPGNCPICGMKLTPIRKQPAERGSAEWGARAERKVKFYKS